MKLMHGDIKDISDDLHAHKVEAAKTYVPFSVLDKKFDRLEATLERIETKLDGKADK